MAKKNTFISIKVEIISIKLLQKIPPPPHIKKRINYTKLYEIIRNYTINYTKIIIRNYTKLYEIIRNYTKLYEIIYI